MYKRQSDLKLDNVVGEAAVIDLSDIQPEQEITAETLKVAGSHLKKGQIVLFKSCWDEQRNWREEHYWRDAPWLSADACQWLLTFKPTAIAFDFPQDWTIRRLLDGEVRPVNEHVSHDILLRNGVTLIEYLIGVGQISTPTTWLCALPLKLPESDGAPSRVIAIQNL